MPARDSGNPDAAAGALCPSPWQAVLILVALSLLAFAPFVRAPLFWDDLIVIAADGPIARPETFARIFTGRCVLFPEGIVYDYYRPVTDLLLYIEYQLAGAHPFVYHLTNLLLHTGNMLIAFWLFRAAAGGGARATWAALLGAGIFGLHPMQVESALWAAARPAITATFFCGLALLCVRNLAMNSAATRVRKSVHAILAVAFFILAMLAKESAVVYPAAAMPLLLLRGRRELRPALLVIALAWPVIVVYLVANSMAGVRTGGAFFADPGVRLPMALQGIGFYARRLIWPHPLYPSYGQFIHQTTVNLALGGVILLATIGTVGWLAWRRAPRGLLMAAAILLTLGGAVLPFVGGVLDVADRYLYHSLWGIGLFATLVHTRWTTDRANGWKSPRVLAILALLLALSLMSLRQSIRWTDGLALWKYSHAQDPLNPMSSFHVAKSHETALETDAAIEWYLRTIALPYPEPTREQIRAAHHALCLCVYRQDYEQAAALYPLASKDPVYGEESKVWAAMALLSLGRRDEGMSLYRDYRDDGKRAAGVYRNLALIARHFAGDPDAAARWEAMAATREPQP